MNLYPELKIAANHNAQASFVAAETVFPIAPRFTPVGRPPVVFRLGSGAIRRDGWLFHDWRWGVLRWAYLNTFVTTYLGGWTTDSANVTLRTLKTAHTYGNYNAIVYLPTFEGDDEYGGYEEPTTAKLINVRIRFLLLASI